MKKTDSQKTSPERTVFCLGRVHFEVVDASVEFLQFLKSVLPQNEQNGRDVYMVECQNNFRTLLNEVLNSHGCKIWIDAACLVSLEGKSVLLAGKSGAGKSTTAMALVWENNWKLLAEDLVLINDNTAEVIGFASPFSLKSGTLDLLKQTITNVPETVIDDEWVPVSQNQCKPGCSSNFDFAIFLGAAQHGGALHTTILSKAEYVRQILPCSSLLHDDGALEWIMDNLQNTTCLLIEGGTLQERLSKLLELARNN